MIIHQQHHHFPVYDGVYGKISIFPKEAEGEKPKEEEEQMSLF